MFSPHFFWLMDKLFCSSLIIAGLPPLFNKKTFPGGKAYGLQIYSVRLSA